MPDTKTLETVARCDHGADVHACPFCAVEYRDTGQRLTRSARRLAASLRAAIERAERERDTVRGYDLLSGTVSASGTRSPVLDGIGNAADSIGHAFYSDVTGDTIERVARWIGNAATDRERVAMLLTSDGSPVSYASRIGRRVARSIARGTGTGRGSMPRVVSDRERAERELVARYRDTLRDVPAFTVAAVKLRRETALDVLRAMADGAPLPRRAFTAAERELVLDTWRPERAERAPLFAPWLDGLGDGLANPRDGHGSGHVAPYVPERDAAPLRRGSIVERVAAVGADVDTVRAIRAAWDIVNVPDGRGRYRSRVPWSDIATGLGVNVSPDTVARHARAVLRAVVARETEARRPDGAPFTLPDPVPVVTTRLVPVATGRTIGRGIDHGSPVVAPSITWRRAPRTVRQFDGSLRRETYTTATPITGSNGDTVPLWLSDPCPCDVPNNGSHVDTCPVRVARSLRVARIATIGADSDRATVRAVIDQNATERANMTT